MRGDPPRPDDHRPSPPWWPEGESWPPPRWAGGRRYRGGRGSWSSHRRWRPFGCLFLLFGLFAAGTMVVGAWAAAALLGLVSAPPIVVGAGLVAFVLVALGALGVARGFRRLSGPLDALIEASGRIEAGDYSTRVTVEGSGEMRSLARAFNQMSERLEASDARRRAFLADVAHELRTPLTVMQGQLEAIEDGLYQPDGEHIAALLSHTRSMTRLVEDLRTISLAEVGALELSVQPVDVVALSEEVAAAYRSAASDRNVELRVEGPEDAGAMADRSALGRVLGNVVSNALRHTAAGGHVTIRVIMRPAEGHTLIDVVDDGAGMTADQIGRAFERFEKGPDSEGSGLGLAIARDLVETQGGHIELHSEADAGTTVRIRLDAAEADG